MSMYTVTVRKLLEDERTKAALIKALSSYPLYEQKETGNIANIIPTREELNNKIINHFKYREIGFETVGRFLDELEISMCEIMPYYNQMFRTVDIMNAIEDPFGNVDVTETYEETRTGNRDNTTNLSTTTQSESTSEGSTENKGTATSNEKTEGLHKENDTPGNRVDDIDNYLSMATKDDTDRTTSSSDTSTGKQQTTSNGESSGTSQGTDKTVTEENTKHKFHKKGNQGVNTYAHDMIELRQTILNIEQMIINDSRIQELFMLIY